MARPFSFGVAVLVWDTRLRKSERLSLDVNSRVRNRECVHSIPRDRSRAEAQKRGTQSNLPRLYAAPPL